MPHQHDQPVQALVESLADALDADDFDAVHRLLDPDCVYEVGGDRHVGRHEVIASYRSGSQLGRELFDEIRFSHEPVVAIAGGRFRVRYLDHLRAGEEMFVHVSEQDVTATPDGGITRIVDRTDPAERARLDAFMARHGITRPH
jgi:hypothetical protein